VWSTVLLVALMAAPDPVRLGVALMVISRPRPMRNLLMFWLGAMATGTVTVLGLLALLRNVAPTLTQQLVDLAASPIARHIQVVVGVCAIAIAAVITVGFSVRQRVAVPVAAGDSSVGLLEPSASQRPGQCGERRLKGKSFWAAVVIGLGLPPEHTAVVLTAILASEAAVATQVGAVIVFVVIMLALIEIPLISYLFKPEKTQWAMVQLCNWVTIHRRRIIAAILAVAGVILMVTGMGVV
jgi:Sap, sulfolipid-1-addressing protein